MARYRVTADAPTTPGTVSRAVPGDVVTVDHSATRRQDWAPLATAVMIAFCRGADVQMSQGDTRG